MQIGQRIRQLRELKGLSQGDIERKTALMRCYISRVENGYTVPSLETMERLAAALETPLYRLFYDGGELPEVPQANPARAEREFLAEEGDPDANAQLMLKLKGLVKKMSEDDRRVFLALARTLARGDDQRGNRQAETTRSKQSVVEALRRISADPGEEQPSKRRTREDREISI